MLGWTRSDGPSRIRNPRHRTTCRTRVRTVNSLSVRLVKSCVFKAIGSTSAPVDPDSDDDTRTEIARTIDSLIAEIGGVDAICRLCGIISQHGKIHDGMWLLGNLPCRPDQPPIPWVPVGWLLSIALRHIQREPSTDDPDPAWNTALQLATVFAASMDCQRYNQFDGFFIEAPDFVPTLAESLAWRELFTLPQIPPSELSILRDAFSQITWPQGTDDLGRDVDRLFAELDELQSGLAVDRLTAIPRWAAQSAFPLLWEHARAPGTGVNAQYLDPFGGHPRDHDRYVFFDGPEEHVSVLPSPLAAASACEAIFRLIWKRAKSAAKDIVGDTVEEISRHRVRHALCLNVGAGVLPRGRHRAGDGRCRTRR